MKRPKFRSDEQRKAAFANMFGGTGGKRSKVSPTNVKNFDVGDFKLKAMEGTKFGKIKQEHYKMPSTSVTMPDPRVFKGKSLTSENKSRPPPSIARKFVTVNNLAFNEMTNPKEMTKNNIAEFMSDVQLKKAYSTQTPITTLDKFIESHSDEEVMRLLNLSTEDAGFDNSFLELDTPLGKDAPSINFAAYKYFGDKAFDIRTNTFGEMEEKVYILRPEYRKKTIVRSFEDARDGGVTARIKVRPGQSGTLVFETGDKPVTPGEEGETPEATQKGVIIEGGLYQTKQNVYTSDQQAVEGIQPTSPLVSTSKTRPKIPERTITRARTDAFEKLGKRPGTTYYEVDQPLLDIDRQMLGLEDVKDATDPSRGKFVYKKQGKLSRGDQKKLNAKELKGPQTPEFVREQEKEKVAMEKAEKVAADLVTEQKRKEAEIVEVGGEKISPDILIQEKEKREKIGEEKKAAEEKIAEFEKGLVPEEKPEKKPKKVREKSLRRLEKEAVESIKEKERLERSRKAKEEGKEEFERAIADVDVEPPKPRGVRAKIKAAKEKKQKLRKEIGEEIEELEKEIAKEKAKPKLTPTEERELKKVAALRIKKRQIKPEEEKSKPPAPRPGKVSISKRKPAERPKPVPKKRREKTAAEKVRSGRRLEKVIREGEQQIRKESKERTKASADEVNRKFAKEIKGMKALYKGNELNKKLNNLALRYEAGKRKGFASDAETKSFALNQTRKNVGTEIGKIQRKKRPTADDIRLLGRLKKFKIVLDAGS